MKTHTAYIDPKTISGNKRVNFLLPSKSKSPGGVSNWPPFLAVRFFWAAFCMSVVNFFKNPGDPDIFKDPGGDFLILFSNHIVVIGPN